MPAAKLSNGLFLGVFGYVTGYEDVIIKLCSRYKNVTLCCVDEVSEYAEKLAYRMEWGIHRYRAPTAQLEVEQILNLLSNVPNRAAVIIGNRNSIASKCLELNIPCKVLK